MTTTSKAERIKAALEEIRAKHGGKLRPRDVWKEARKNKKSILHREFEWNVSKAAERHWDDRARDLITRFITVVVVERAHKITGPYYVHDPRAARGEQSYIALTSAQVDRNHAREIMLAELDRCKASIKRARNVSAVLNVKHPGISDQLEGLLSDIVNMQEDLRAA